MINSRCLVFMMGCYVVTGVFLAQQLMYHCRDFTVKFTA